MNFNFEKIEEDWHTNDNNVSLEIAQISNRVNETNMTRIWNPSIKFRISHSIKLMASKHKQTPFNLVRPCSPQDAQGKNTPPQYHSKAGYGARQSRRKVFVAMYTNEGLKFQMVLDPLKFEPRPKGSPRS